ncbi:KAP family NTPase [Pseudoalteromonas sp. DL2-H2.2]|uniref:KAP family P-loop NTPase fold protein n=1 Tax=Pseudoalteromonas sp. DL2-H2.2 TaxID=2908889 RepID=UPI001F448E92|nr:P-loop NTPase fold protein [Pseudoalteromonas sp. DL2-H2.2]MCF2906932.1 KAP family NTPase [Pseudoalteromonas sp. DL2-H2.2]
MSEITSQLKSQHDGYVAAEWEAKLIKLIEQGKKVWNSLVKIGGCVAAVKGYGPIYSPLKDLTTFEITDKQGQSLESLYMKQREAVKELKQFLREYYDVINTFKGDRTQIAIFVDELDRCRPNYAMELLETIKHFFELEGYLFVIATDTEQLSHSIKAVYGSEFDGREYLSRFFNPSAKLPEPDKFTI